jgi:hypothetical protein
MKYLQLKTVNILSDGSLNFSFKCFTNNKQLLDFEKDNKSLSINNKKKSKIINFESHSKYKKKYLI